MGDDWLALDKVEHFASCFLITAVVVHLAGRTRLRKWRIMVGALVGLVAGAAKEAGDATGIWPSAGASVKDGVADMIGVAAAVLWNLFLSPLWRQKPQAISKDGIDQV
ncbi:putative lipoprotein [Marchantia polymorpha subsp. ruderalis]|uniref:Uncharacterized protein n=2 Tax=Marchantia polymorpha TaxID=3197 RepID=A0AAF6BUW6_MARPO|nr:hypothetical protein MARPO_0046s0029 [Marchantia polymorpha]BBN15800.1 hypothetical protein Mp_7g00950 [Marchantia polymorpha subsp. ruderalis]|eukprot:PTQ39206.1 hypothetical protein MARPO_0046s0029 [Marchantia polymorpha]